MTLDFEVKVLELFLSWDPVDISLVPLMIYGGFEGDDEMLFLKLLSKFFKAWSFFTFYCSYFFFNY